MSIIEIKGRLERKETTSIKLVMEAIKNHETWIDKNALAHVSPFALYQAQILDKEREEGKIRGPLHGIPLVIKDNILYQDGTPTTASAFSLHDLIPPFNAHIVELLIKSGAIILGKANLSEFAYFMSDDDMPSGYGSMYGQVKHPFNENIDPYGSSTGSAVAVKLGIVDVSIGTETNGSLMAPAYQCQIVSYKPSFGFVSKHGIIPISPTQDTAGPIAHTVQDCALLMDVLASEDINDQTTLNLKRPKSFSMNLDQKLKPSKIGLIVIKNDLYDETERQIIEKTTKRLNILGHQVIEIIIDKGHIPNELTLLTEFKYAMNAFLNQVKGSTQMKTLQDIIEFNWKNERRCLRYGQSILIKSDETSGNLEDKDYQMNREILISNARRLEDLMIEKDLVCVISPRWYGVLISGFLGGIGGLVYALPISVSFEGTVAGYGFLALAVLIFGQWKPMRILFAAIFFGVFKTLSVTFFGFSWINYLIETFPNIPFGMIFRMLPYIATMVVLAIFSKKSKAPKASGKPFLGNAR